MYSQAFLFEKIIEREVDFGPTEVVCDNDRFGELEIVIAKLTPNSPVFREQQVEPGSKIQAKTETGLSIEHGKLSGVRHGCTRCNSIADIRRQT